MTTTPRAVRRLLVVAACVSVGSACNQEKRDFREFPPSASPIQAVRVSDLQPGGAVLTESTTTTYGNNAYALNEGMRLYDQMNCSGCHFKGGGGIGPPLMDDQWIYGSDPSQIFATIVEGRPNGMPSFKGRLTNQQVWQLVAYVRSLSGLEGTSISSARQDHMYLSPDLQLRAAEKPKGKTVP
ncbi:MAG: c-type cytochrome [Gemmatimonadaceae bacterium]